MSSTTETNQQTPLKFEFRGDGMEYFKIWIVNVLLTTLSLGIYSAWATVRNNKYFYSNLYLDNTNFRYLADPITILKGRLIAIAALIVYSIVARLLPMVAIGLMVLLMIAIPYFVNQSLKFNHRMSAYKNIQFRFSGSYKEAFMVIYVWPILGMLTLGILYPLSMLKMHEYQAKNSAYGTTKFDYNATFKEYGIIFLIMLGVGIMVGLPIWGLTALIPPLRFVSPFLMMFLYLALIIFFMVRINNLFFRSLSLSTHGFKSTLTMAGLTKVMMINFILTLGTFGLYLPAAKVRMAKYFADNIIMNATESLDNFSAAEQENVSAVGDELGQAFDFGL